MPHATPLRRRLSVRQLLLLLAFAAAGCRGLPTPEPADSDHTDGASNARLALTVAPVNGEAPLAVELSAELLGDVAALADGGCPSLAWSLGNGDVVLAQAAGCAPGVVPRRYALAYTYRGAGSFDASVRLLALDVPASNRVSVLVRGPTATPAPRVAQAGPTIVIATAAATRALATARPTVRPAPASSPIAATVPPATRRATALAATAIALAPADTPTVVAGQSAAPALPSVSPVGVATAEPGRAATGAPPTSPSSATAAPLTAVPPPATIAAPTRVPAAARVLPADLYYLTPFVAGLMRLGAAGGSPETVLPGPVTDYAVAASGLVAFVAGDGGALKLMAPGAQPVTIAPAKAAAPVWAPDGRRLAYAQDGVFAYDLGTGQSKRLLDDEATPLAWSRDGRWLALRRAGDGGLTLVSSAGARQDLPIGPVVVAGWLPDRDVLWVGGRGLVLLTVGATVEQTRLLAKSVKVLAGTVTADRRLLALGDDGRGAREYTTDLGAAVLNAEVTGPLLPALPPPEDLAWAPGGQALAAGYLGRGLDLLAPGSGAAVVLVPGGGRRPAWVLGAR